MNFNSLASGIRDSFASLIDAFSDNFKGRDLAEEGSETKEQTEEGGELDLERTKSLRRSNTCPEKPKDEVRRAYEVLCYDFHQVQDEYKRLRGVVEQLGREYEDSKEVDVFRRYGMLKGMIKRSVLHLKLSMDEENPQMLASCGKQKEEMRKRSEHLSGLSTDEVSAENDKLQDQIKSYKNKISLIQDLIGAMERNYAASKRYVVVQRYRLMKSTVKAVIHNQWL